MPNKRKLPNGGAGRGRRGLIARVLLFTRRVVNPWDHFWASRISAEDFYPQHERIERVVRDLGEWRGTRALEVGCGMGGSARFMLELGMKPILLDYSQASLDKCRARYPRGSGVSLVRGDVFHLPFKNNSIGLVFHQGLIEHFRGEGPAAILRENLRVLTPVGWLVVDVPQAFHLESIFARPFIWTGKWFAGWQTYYSLPRLKRLARAMGIENPRYFGAWMNPSFAYRALRWALKSRINLPRDPPRIGFIHQFRKTCRQRLFYHPLALWTGASIGFAGKKTGG